MHAPRAVKAKTSRAGVMCGWSGQSPHIQSNLCLFTLAAGCAGASERSGSSGCGSGGVSPVWCQQPTLLACCRPLFSPSPTFTFTYHHLITISRSCELIQDWPHRHHFRSLPSFLLPLSLLPPSLPSSPAPSTSPNCLSIHPRLEFIIHLGVILLLLLLSSYSSNKPPHSAALISSRPLKPSIVIDSFIPLPVSRRPIETSSRLHTTFIPTG